MAGRKPLVTLAAEPRCPLAAKTELAIAIAKTAPKRCIMLLMPDAFPISDGVTALRTAVGTVGRAIDMPIPATRSASTSSRVLAAAEALRATQPRPIANCVSMGQIPRPEQTGRWQPAQFAVLAGSIPVRAVLDARKR